MRKDIVKVPKYKVTILTTPIGDPMQAVHLKMMNIPKAWEDSRGRGVKVVVLDTGKPKHDDLHINGAENFVRDQGIMDKQGHSTHCCGVIAATANNGIGICGVAPEAQLYTGKVLGDNGSGDIVAIIKGIRWAVDIIGADVISMSLGVNSSHIFNSLVTACRYANSKGTTLVCAAGNDAGPVSQPARYNSTIAVAAVDRELRHAKFSNIGSSVDFCTGGTQILSTYLHNGYATLQGTSMACPAIAGVAALIISKHRKLGKELTPKEVKEHIGRLSQDLGPIGDDKYYGQGIPIFGAQQLRRHKPPVKGWGNKFTKYLRDTLNELF